MEKVILKFWMQDEKNGVPCGKFHNLVIKAVPALDYSNQGKPFIYLTSERRVDKYEDGDYSYDEPGYTLLVKSYETVEELSDKNWKRYIKLKVFGRIGDLQLSLFAKHVPIGKRNKTDGFLCMDIAKIV
jgi:hypothetical protein